MPRKGGRERGGHAGNRGAFVDLGDSRIGLVTRRHLVQSVQPGHRAVGQSDQKAGAAAQTRHARLGDRQREANRDGGVDRVAAFREDARASRGSVRSRGRDDAIAALGTLGGWIGNGNCRRRSGRPGRRRAGR
jgi:hypothetical protein